MGVSHGEEFPTHRDHPHVELLAQLAASRVQIGLAGFELSARKLPQAAVPLVEGTTANKVALVVPNDCREDADG